ALDRRGAFTRARRPRARRARPDPHRVVALDRAGLLHVGAGVHALAACGALVEPALAADRGPLADASRPAHRTPLLEPAIARDRVRSADRALVADRPPGFGEADVSTEPGVAVIAGGVARTVPVGLLGKAVARPVPPRRIDAGGRRNRHAAAANPDKAAA